MKPKTLPASRRLLPALLTLVLLAGLLAPVYAADTTVAAGAGTPPVSNIPLRAAVESCGGTVTWDAATKSVLISHANMEAAVAVGRTEATLNGSSVTLKMAPYINDMGRTVIGYDFLRPLFLSENPQQDAFIDYAVPYIYQLMNSTSAAGMTLAFVDTGIGAPWLQGFGYADLAEGQVVTADTRFEIGSISKTFTALGIMQQVEKGTIMLDHAVSSYLSDFTIGAHPARGGSSGDITVRMLGQHISGIPGTWLPHFLTYDDGAWRRYDDTLKNLSSMSLSFAPGDSFAYSNMAVSLLGAVLARVTGVDAGLAEGFIRYQNENIFQPLEMTSTSFLPQPGAGASKTYDAAALPEARPVYLPALPAGSVTSTAEDMSHYIEMMLAGGVWKGKTLLQKSSIDEMYRQLPLTGARSQGITQGFIWQALQLSADKTIYFHDGATANFYSILLLDPETGLGLFLSTNTRADGGMTILAGLEMFRAAIEQKTGKTLTPLTRPETTPTVADAAYLQKLVGKWGPQPAEMRISQDGGLIYRFNGKDYPLTAQSDGTFLDADGIRYFFRDVDDTIMIGLYSGVTPTYAGEKLPEIDTDLMIDFVGSWTWRNTDNDDYMTALYPRMRIEIKDGLPLLFMTEADQSGIVLVPVNRTICYVAGYGRGQGDVLTLKTQNGRPVIEYCGAVFEKTE